MSRRFFKEWSIDTKIELYDEKCFHLHACFKSKNFSFTSRRKCHEDFDHVLDENESFVKSEAHFHMNWMKNVFFKLIK
jgi:hypothetical protein